MVLPTRESRPTVAERLGSVQASAGTFKREMQVASRGMARGPVSSNAVIQLSVNIGEKIRELQAVRNHSGINAHARAAFGDAGMDYVAEVDATLIKLVDVLTAAVAALPKDGAGNIMGRKVDAGGAQTFEPLTKAQTASLVTALDAAIATIE